MPLYRVRTPDGRLMKIRGEYPPTQQIVEEAYSKLPPLQPTKEVIPEIQGVERPSIDPAPKNIDKLMKTSFVMPGYGKGDGGRLTNAARMIAGASSPAIRDAGRQDIKGELKTLADILSYVATPAGLVSKIPAAMKVRRSLAQTFPQAAAGGLSTYLGEREKGQFVSDALKTAAQQVGIETVVGSGLDLGAKLSRDVGNLLKANIPEEVFQKADKYKKEIAEPVEKRIEQLIGIGKKAGEKLKSIPQTLSKKMEGLSKKFFKENEIQSKIKKISNIDNKQLSDAINNEYLRLQDDAREVIQNGKVLRSKSEEKKVLKKFEDLFIAREKPKPKDFLGELLFDRKMRTTSAKEPALNREEIIRSLDKIQDSSGFDAGEQELKKYYARIYNNLNDFLKRNSPEYKKHKELGQKIVRFSKYETERNPDLYNPKKLQKAFENSIGTFKSNPDPDSLKVIEEVIGKKGKAKEIIEEYNKNIDLSELGTEGILTKGEAAEKLAKNPEQMGRIRKALPPDLVEKIEIEAAQSSLDPKKLSSWFGGPVSPAIPLIGSPLYKATQAGKKAYKSPVLTKFARDIYKTDKPQQIKEAARNLLRYPLRELMRTDEQVIEPVRSKETGKQSMLKRSPYETRKTWKRKMSGEFKPAYQQKLKQERGVQ